MMRRLVLWRTKICFVDFEYSAAAEWPTKASGSGLSLTLWSPLEKILTIVNKIYHLRTEPPFRKYRHRNS